MKSTKGHGYFRKSKAYGLIAAIALSGALYVSNGTSLAEETTATPKTEAVSDLGEVPHVPSEELAPGVAYDKNIYTLLDPELKDIAEKARENRVGLFRKSVINKGRVTTKEELEKVLNEIKEEQKVVKEQIEKALPIQIKRNEIYDKALNAYNDYYNFVEEEVANGNVQKNTATAWPERYSKNLDDRNRQIITEATLYKKNLEDRIETYKKDKNTDYSTAGQKHSIRTAEKIEEFKEHIIHYDNKLKINNILETENIKYTTLEELTALDKENEKVLETAKAYADKMEDVYNRIIIGNAYNKRNEENLQELNSFENKESITVVEKEFTNSKEIEKFEQDNKSLLRKLNSSAATGAPAPIGTFYKITINEKKILSEIDENIKFKFKFPQYIGKVVTRPSESPVLKPKNTHEKVFFNDYVITYALPAEETDSNQEKPNTDKPVEEKPNTDKPVEEKPNTDKPVEEKPNTDKPVEEKPNTDKPVEEKPSTENKTTTTAKKQILPTNNQIVKNSEKATPTKTPTTSTTIGIGLGLTASSILTMLGLAKRKKD